MSNFAITKFQADDNRNLALAHISLISDARWTPDGDFLNMQIYDDWVANGVTCIVAQDREDGRVLGGAAIKGDGPIAELIAVIVDRAARGSGVANGLIAAAVKHCCDTGFARIVLDIRLTDAGLPEAALRLYEAHGFKLVPGVKVTEIGWCEKSRHLWRNADPGGVFRSRVMAMSLSSASSVPTQKGGRDVA